MTIKESQMRKFDIDAALNGVKVCTKAGDIVTQITVFDTVNSEFCIAGVLKGCIKTWSKDGYYFEYIAKANNNLRIYEEEKSKQQWINIFTESKTKKEFPNVHIFNSKETAKKYAKDLGVTKHRQVRIDNI